METADRERIARALAMRCPVCTGWLRPTDDSARSLHHGRSCAECGAVVLFPRVALVRAIKKAGRTS